MKREQKFIQRVALLCGLLIFTVAAFAEPREWTNSDGRKIEAELTGIEGDDAILTMKGSNFNVPIKSLSADDQTFIATWQKGKAASAPTPEGSKSTASSENEAPFDNWDADWPSIITADVTPEIETIQESDEGYIYASPHYEFHCDVRLNQSVVKKFSVLFEATNQLMRELPLSFGKAHREKRHKILLFETEQSYFRAGGPQGSAGVYMTGKDVIMVPLTSLGVKKVGSGYMVDRDGSNKTLPHEITHQLTDMPYYAAGGWFSEGLAEYVGTTPYRSGKFQVDSLTALRDYVTAYGKDDKGGRALGEEIDMPRMKDWMTQSYSSFLNNPQVNYGVGALVVYYFFHMDGDKDAVRIKEFLKALKAGKKEEEAFAILLNGRTWEEMEEQVTKEWRSRRVKLNWGG